jgi:hypothetical protein
MGTKMPSESIAHTQKKGQSSTVVPPHVTLSDSEGTLDSSLRSE